jgi:glycosyltransferase involved in cell wall biosynthesis
LGEQVPRILFHLSNSFSDTQVIGGAELGMLVVMKALRAKGFEPYVMMHGGGLFKTLLERSSIPSVICPLRPSSRALSRNKRFAIRGTYTAVTEIVRTAYKVLDAVRAWEIDIIHANHLSGFLSCGLAAKLARIPNIWHLHEGLDPGLVSRVLQEVAPWLADHLITMAPFEASTVQSMTNRVDHSMIEGAFAFDELMAAPNKSAENVRKEFGIANDDLLVAYVSHLAPYKGQGTFITALAGMPQGGPRLKALIVGGPRKSFEDFPENLRRQIKSLELNEVVTLTGYRADVADIMNAADICVCVSESEEFNRVLIEAMAFGKPVIASDMRGGSIVLENGKSGLLVRPADATMLRSALVELREREIRVQLGNNARHHVFEKFSIERIVLKYQDVYLALLDRFKYRQRRRISHPRTQANV